MVLLFVLSWVGALCRTFLPNDGETCDLFQGLRLAHDKVNKMNPILKIQPPL